MCQKLGRRGFWESGWRKSVCMMQTLLPGSFEETGIFKRFVYLFRMGSLLGSFDKGAAIIAKFVYLS